MEDSSKINDSKIKRSIIASKRVKIWFWDTQREYSGEAVALSATDLTALLKIGGGAATTMVPSNAIMEGLIRHLTGRVVEFKVTGMGQEVVLKGTIKEFQRDFENPRRLLLIATLASTSEKNQVILKNLGSSLPAN